MQSYSWDNINHMVENMVCLQSSSGLFLWKGGLVKNYIFSGDNKNVLT